MIGYNESNLVGFNFSQRTVSEVRVFDTSKYTPINVIKVDGQLVPYDNRRLLSAQNAEIEKLEVNVVKAEDIHLIGSRHVTVWKETANERKILILGKGGGRLIERDMSTGSYKENVIIPEIPLTDNDTIDKYELTNVRNYAEFNEPSKDLIIDRSIPSEYQEYIDIISS